MSILDRELTEEEKKAECKRICGDSADRGIHSMAPELCPIQWDIWRNPPKRKAY